MRSPICAAALVAAASLSLAGCVTGGLDAETKAALQTTMSSVQELTELWQERLDAADVEEETGLPEEMTAAEVEAARAAAEAAAAAEKAAAEALAAEKAAWAAAEAEAAAEAAAAQAAIDAARQAQEEAEAEALRAAAEAEAAAAQALAEAQAAARKALAEAAAREAAQLAATSGAAGRVGETGQYLQTGTEEYDEYSVEHLGRFEGTRTTWSHHGWGLWLGEGTFTATITGTMLPGGPSPSLADPFHTSVTGRRSFDNPSGSGTAVWTGNVRSYETHPDTFGTPVEGDARLEMNLDGLLDDVDVRFTGFDRGHASMSWYSVSVTGGGFRAYSPGDLEGDFYGDGHEGVAGTFHRAGLKGVFGAARE